MLLCLREWSAMPQYQNLLPFNMQLFGVFTTATKVSVSILFQNISATGMMNGLPMRSSRTQLWQNFFTYRVVKLWNNLPEEVVMAPTVNCFKGCFDRHSADNRWNGNTDQLKMRQPSRHYSTRQHNGEYRSTGILPIQEEDDDVVVADWLICLQ